MATWRLFISPSSSGADRLSELKLLRSSARKRLRSWRGAGGAVRRGRRRTGNRMKEVVEERNRGGG